ncbi:MAG: S-layer homology domain-containing protein [Bacillota bacterium]
MKSYTKIIMKVLTVTVLLLTATGFRANAASLIDIKEGQSFYSEINYLVDEEIISGYNDGTFRPTEKVTRAAAAAMIGRSLGLDGAQKKSSFDDVAQKSFASGYIESAVEEGIIKGFTDGTFRPNQEVTRGQMAIFIARAFDLKEKQAISFYDVTSSMAAYESIQKILADGITQGYKDWTFRPNKGLSRAEFSAFLARALNEGFKVEIPEIESIEINYSITNSKKVDSNYHNGKLFVLKPNQQINLNKLNTNSDRVLINGQVLAFEDQNTIVARQSGVGYITIIPGGYDWEEAYNYEVLVGAKEDVTKSILNHHFLELAGEGYLNGCEFSLDDVRTENVMNYFDKQPSWSGYFGGGFGRKYDGCIYYGGDSTTSGPISAIDLTGEKLPKTPAQIKQVIGKPDYEGYDAMDGLWMMYYEVNEYELYFLFDSPDSKLSYLRYKEINPTF